MHKAIACNYLDGTGYCATGAKAYLTGLSGISTGRVMITTRSRGGRWIDRWERLDRLGNFRFVSPPVGKRVMDAPQDELTPLLNTLQARQD